MNGKTIRSAVYLVIFALVTLALTYVLAVTIENGSAGSTTSYRAAFTDTTGLLAGDDVRIAGVRVGHVNGVKLIMPTDKAYRADCASADSAKVATPKSCSMVTFGLDKSFPLESTAIAALKYRNLVGERYLDIEQRPGNGQPMAKNGLMTVDKTAPALDLTVLFNGFQPLFKALDPEDINSVAYEVVASLQGEGNTLDQLLSNTGSLSTTIASQDAAIGSLIDNLNGVLSTVDARDSELTTLVDQLQRLTTGLAGDRDEIASSLSNVNLLAESTTRLLSGIRPYLPTDLTQLSGVARTLATTTTTNDQGKTQNQLDEFLNRFPSKITTITRTASYGGYFNFYLCQANVTLAKGVTVSVTNNNRTSCAASLRSSARATG